MSDYKYDAVIKAVHDGDTVTVDVDLGFETWVHNMKLRLYGINAPELITSEGKVAQSFLIQQTPVGSKVVIETVKDKQEKYGRWLATIMIPALTGGLLNVNNIMVSSGHAKAYFGVGPKPV